MGDFQFQKIKIIELLPNTENYSKWIDTLSEIFTHKRNEGREESQTATTSDDVRREVEAIARQESSFAIAQDLETNKYIGYVIMVPDFDDSKLIALADSYVLPEFRKRGVFASLTDSVSEIAQQRGFERIHAIPTIDGDSRRVLERKGYKSTEGDEETLVKQLSPSGQESPLLTEINHPNSLK